MDNQPDPRNIDQPKKVYVESVYNYSWIDIDMMIDELNNSCRNGTELPLIIRQDLRHICEMLRFEELAQPETTETTITYKAIHPSRTANLKG